MSSIQYAKQHPFPYKLALIVSMPRTGSMWTYNIVREMYRMGGYPVFPSEAQISEDEITEQINAVINEPHCEEICVLKTHRSFGAFHNTRFIYNYRNLMDVLISTMRFMNFEFEDALGFVAGYSRITDHYRQFSPEIAIGLDYIDIAEDPLSVALSLRDFLNLQLTVTQIETVVDKFTKGKVESLTANLGKGYTGDNELGAENSSSSRPFARIQQEDGHERNFDLLTGFQSGHVSDYKCGDWRRILTPEQQEVASRVLGKA